jgi:hypothetical protein
MMPPFQGADARRREAARRRADPNRFRAIAKLADGRPAYARDDAQEKADG